MKSSSLFKTALFSLTAMAALTQTAFATTATQGSEIVKIEAGKIYSEAHRQSIGKYMEKVRYDNNGIEMVANLYFPEHFDKSKKYPVIVVGHPGGGVKEQASGLYAKLLTEKGFIAIAFDASHQGESGGLPRHLEDPDKRTGDYIATVDYLTTLPYVDSDKIGMLGICAGGGYSTAATLRDPRVKALTTISAYHVSNRNWDGSAISAENKRTFLQNVAAHRKI
ncbi:alpha/beta hydrolase [Mannheimia indoligenes]|uniref:Alpha/beta hydrolase n=1 Tax=Mannheimia indoligenes TaxID=3103145 RepID=A0ABU7ZG53_9PAST